MSLDDLLASTVSQDFPCLGATSARRHGAISSKAYFSEIAVSEVSSVARDLKAFAADKGSSSFRSFVAVFPKVSPPGIDNLDTFIWELLWALSAWDEAPWPSTIPADPSDRGFKFCFAGEPWFIVGMTPNHSRRARQAPHVMLAFNPASMFEELRERGQYDSMARAIRRRDSAYSGVDYPGQALDDGFGDGAQYSGLVTDEWTCPISETFGQGRVQRKKDD